MEQAHHAAIELFNTNRERFMYELIAAKTTVIPDLTEEQVALLEVAYGMVEFNISAVNGNNPRFWEYLDTNKTPSRFYHGGLRIIVSLTEPNGADDDMNLAITSTQTIDVRALMDSEYGERYHALYVATAPMAVKYFDHYIEILKKKGWL